MTTNPCLLRVCVVARSTYGYIHLSQGHRMGRKRYGHINSAFLWVLGGKKSIWLHDPRRLGVPIVGRNLYCNISPAFSGSPC